MEQSVREEFHLRDRDVREISSLSLAFLGDAVYELVIRTLLVESGGDRPGILTEKKAALVRAQTQAAMADYFQKENLLTPREEEVYRRGRNAHPGTVAKHASVLDYRKATGFECLMAFLYLTGEEKRMAELIRVGLEAQRREERHAE